jgi:hypothetical protein
MHQAVDSNSELVVRNRTEAPRYLRGLDDDPEAYQKGIEEMYRQDRIWIGRSVPGLDINRLNQINKQDIAGDDEDAAGIYQYGDTSTFYRVSADGNQIKIEKQDTRGGVDESAWEPVEVNRASANQVPESTFFEDRRNYEERRNSLENRTGDFYRGRSNPESESSPEAIYEQRVQESLSAEEQTKQKTLDDINGEKDERRKREMIERAIRAKIITTKEAEDRFGYNTR